jgi:hypothetical protein
MLRKRSRLIPSQTSACFLALLCGLVSQGVRLQAQNGDMSLQVNPSASAMVMANSDSRFFLNFGTLDGLGLHRPPGVKVTPVKEGVIYSVQVDLLPRSRGSSRMATIMVHLSSLQQTPPGTVLEGDSLSNLTPIPMSFPGKVVTTTARPGLTIPRLIAILVKNDSDRRGPGDAQLTFTIIGQ